MVTWVGPTPVPPDVQTPAMMLVGSFTGPPGDANTVGSAMHQCKQAAETALTNVGGPPNAVGVSFQCVQSKLSLELERLTQSPASPSHGRTSVVYLGRWRDRS